MERTSSLFILSPTLNLRDASFGDSTKEIFISRTILNTIAGPRERERGLKLLERIEVVGDLPSDRVSHLPVTKKITLQSKTIFEAGKPKKTSKSFWKM